MSKGWISLHREIQDCWIWQDKPFDKCRAWIDILLSCNHADKKIMFSGQMITIKRSQWLTSILQLSDRWGWSRHKVSDFLNLLQDDNMLVLEKDNRRTLITVVNYDIYQTFEEFEGQQKDIQRTSEGHQKDTNNNNKTIINKEIYMSFPLKDGKEYPIEQSFVDEMKELYPKLDVEQELKSAKAWLIGNPDKRKTQKGMKRFLTGWLGRAKPEDKPEPKKNKFQNFESTRKYDFAAMEGEVTKL